MGDNNNLDNQLTDRNRHQSLKYRLDKDRLYTFLKNIKCQLTEQIFKLLTSDAHKCQRSYIKKKKKNYVRKTTA